MGIRQAIADIRVMNTLFTTAEEQAAELGDELPGAEHLLLAVLAGPDDSGRRVFETFGVTAAQVRTAISDTHTLALQSVGIDATEADRAAADRAGAAAASTGPYRSTGGLQEVFQRAVALSKQGGSRGHTLRAAHVVWAVSEVEHGTVSLALRRLGLDRLHLQEAARRAIASASAD